MKRALQKTHSIDRAREIHGLTLSEDAYEKLCNQIANNQAIFLERQSLRISKWLVKLNNVLYPVVYDRDRKSIITFLVEDSFQEDRALANFIEDRIISLDKALAGEVISNPKISRHMRGMVSIGDPNSSKPFGFDKVTCKKIRLEFLDVNSDYAKDPASPKMKDVYQIIRFGLKVLPKMNDRQFILAHCQAGIGRSTATAFILRCMLMGPGKEHVASQLLLKENSAAWPNTSMVKFADKLLKRKGKMIQAVESLDGSFEFLHDDWNISSYNHLNK